MKKLNITLSQLCANLDNVLKVTHVKIIRENNDDWGLVNDIDPKQDGFYLRYDFKEHTAELSIDEPYELADRFVAEIPSTAEFYINENDVLIVKSEDLCIEIKLSILRQANKTEIETFLQHSEWWM